MPGFSDGPPGCVKNCNAEPEDKCAKAKKYYSQKGTAKLPNNADYGKFGWESKRTKIENGKSKPKWHGGVDVPGEIGDPVYAVTSGKVFTGTQKDLGTYVQQTSGKGDQEYKTEYAHLSKILVKNGDVECGDLIGYMGRSGNVPDSSPTHVHIQRYLTKKTYKNPEDPTTLIFGK